MGYGYEGLTNTVKFSKIKLEDFTTFIAPKPVIPPEERPKPPPLVKPLPPPDIREELLPADYRQDVDLKLDTTATYLKDESAHDRTRQTDLYLSGRTYNFTVDGHLRMRDIRKAEKQRFKQDGENTHLFFKKTFF